jgi:hypothetical protein
VADEAPQGNINLQMAIRQGMANVNADNTDDRRDIIREGSSLSGSNKRNNDATEKAVHPQAGVDDSDAEVVDQDPGEQQKKNQGDEKDDPLAA